MNDALMHAPSSPAQVMRAGTMLSADVVQHLASEIATTASRERERRLLTVIGAPLLGVVGTIGGVFVGADTAITGLTGFLASSTVLFLSVAWGARNRALLDRAASDSAVSSSVLLSAVQRVRRGAGPSTALRAALDASTT